MSSAKKSKKGGGKKEQTDSTAPSMTPSGSNTTMSPAVAPTTVPGDASMSPVVVASATTAPVAAQTATTSPILSLLSQVEKGREGGKTPAVVLTPTLSPISSAAPVQEPTSTTAPVLETMPKSKAPTVSPSFSPVTPVAVITPSPGNAPLVFYYPTYAPSPMSGVSRATPAPITLKSDTSLPTTSRPTPLTLDKATGAPAGSSAASPATSPAGPVSMMASTSAPTLAPTSGVYLDRGEPITATPTSASPVVPESKQQYTRKVVTTPISIEIQGSFDLDASKDAITSMMETALAPYLTQGAGSILKGFTISTIFLANGARRLQETIKVVSIIEVSFEIAGTELAELLSFDEVTASNLVSAFFSGDSVKVLVDNIVASGIAIESIKLNGAAAAPASAGEERHDDPPVGKHDDTTNRTALIAGMLSGSVVFAALAAGILVNRHKQSGKFSLEHQLTEAGDEGSGPTKGHRTICGTVNSSQGSVSSQGDFTYNCNETSALQFSPLPKVGPVESPRQKHRWSSPDSAELKMMDGPDLVATTQQRRYLAAPSSDSESVFTTDEPDGLGHGQTPESLERKRWLPSWNRKQPRNRTERPSQDEHYDTIEIDGEMKTVYLTPIDIL